MTLTRAWAARDALHALLVTAAAPLGAQVWDGRPNFEHDYHDNVYVDTAETSQEWTSLGRLRREETITIGIVVEAFRGGGDQAPAKARARELAQIVGDAVIDKTDTKLAGTVRWTRPDTIAEELEIFADGYLARITVRLVSEAHTEAC